MALFIKAMLLLLLTASPAFAKRLKIESQSHPALVAATPPSGTKDNASEADHDGHSQVAHDHEEGGGLLDNVRDTLKARWRWLQEKMRTPEEAPHESVEESLPHLSTAPLLRGKMDFLKDAVFAEPTVCGQIGAALIQFAIWGLIIKNYQNGIMAHVQKWATSKSWYPNVQENYKDDDAQEIYHFPDPGFNYVQFAETVIHHGIGGILMSLGMLTGQTWLWRHGMLVEVGGMDLLDFVRIVWCKLSPPGHYPTSEMVKSPIFVPLMFFHHSVGLCVGIPVNLFFSDVFKFQLFGLIILGAPALALLPSLYVKTLHAKENKGLLLANQVYIFLCFGIVQRVLFYFPAAISCFMHMWRSELFSWSIAIPFAWALGALSIFNLMILGIFGGGLYKVLTAKTEEEHTHLLKTKNLGTLHCVTKLLTKAHRARQAVKAKGGLSEALVPDTGNARGIVD